MSDATKAMSPKRQAINERPSESEQRQRGHRENHEEYRDGDPFDEIDEDEKQRDENERYQT